MPQSNNFHQYEWVNYIVVSLCVILHQRRRDLEIIIRELADQVATRIRRQNYLAGTLILYAGNMIGSLLAMKRWLTRTSFG